MFGIDDAIMIPAAASILGGVLRNSSQEQQAQKQIEFQERMSSTAHQREVQDLIAAGLNPMLSAKLGGASSPAGAQANIQDVLSPAVASGQQGKLLSAQLEQIKSQVELNKANAQNALADIWVKNAQIDNLGATTEQARSAVGLQGSQQGLIAKQILQMIEQTLLTKSQTRLTGEQTVTQRGLQDLQAAQTGREEGQTRLLGKDEILRHIQGRLAELDLPRGVAESKFYEGAVGEQNPMIRLVLQLISVLNRVGR